MQVLAWTTRGPARICPITGRYGRCFCLGVNLFFPTAARGACGTWLRTMGGRPGPPGPVPVRAGWDRGGRYPAQGSSSNRVAHRNPARRHGRAVDAEPVGPEPPRRQLGAGQPAQAGQGLRGQQRQGHRVKDPAVLLDHADAGPELGRERGVGHVEFAAGGRPDQRRSGVGPGPFGIKGPVARHLGPFPYGQPGEAAAHLPVPDERPPAITRHAMPRDLGAVQLLGRHGFDWIPPQRDDAPDHGHDRLHKLEGALTDGSGVERGGFGPSQRLSTLLFYARGQEIRQQGVHLVRRI